MKMTNKEYGEYIKKYESTSPMPKNIVLAYLVGGLICVLGQALFNLYLRLGLDREDALTAVPVTLVFLGALFTGLKLYDNLAKYAGAGTIVPITGFANAIVSPALEFKSEGFILGMSAKMFTRRGPRDCVRGGGLGRLRRAAGAFRQIKSGGRTPSLR